MHAQARCLNLANSVAIVLYEALRQQQFPNLVVSKKIDDCSADLRGSIQTNTSALF
jgi:tRNA C32,U32 (ribose-2'-O)-methylase TrmJ